MVKEVFCDDCLDSITSTSTVSLSTSTMLILHARTFAITESDQLTRNKSKQLFEGRVFIAWFVSHAITDGENQIPW